MNKKDKFYQINRYLIILKQKKKITLDKIDIH